MLTAQNERGPAAESLKNGGQDGCTVRRRFAFGDLPIAFNRARCVRRIRHALRWSASGRLAQRAIVAMQSFQIVFDQLANNDAAEIGQVIGSSNGPRPKYR